jgi:hypothetical protein
MHVAEKRRKINKKPKNPAIVSSPSNTSMITLKFKFSKTENFEDGNRAKRRRKKKEVE